jgi:hypothetical protein
MRWSSPGATAGIMARYVLRGLPELSLHGNCTALPRNGIID